MKKLSAKKTKEKMFNLVKDCLAFNGQKEEFIKLHGLIRQRYFIGKKGIWRSKILLKVTLKRWSHLVLHQAQ